MSLDVAQRRLDVARLRRDMELRLGIEHRRSPPRTIAWASARTIPISGAMRGRSAAAADSIAVTSAYFPHEVAWYLRMLGARRAARLEGLCHLAGGGHDVHAG